MRGRRTSAALAVATTALGMSVVSIAPPATAAAVASSSATTYITRQVVGGESTAVFGTTTSAVTVAAGTVSATLLYSLRMTLRPAAGGRFTTGQVDDHLWAGSPGDLFLPDDVASATFSNGGLWCPTVLPTGYLRVDDAQYDGTGALTSLAAHVRVTCTSTGSVIDSDIRVASAIPAHAVGWWGLVNAVGPSGTAAAYLVNRGTVDEPLGALTVVDKPADWPVAEVARGTCGDSLAPGASCIAQLTWDSAGNPGTVRVLAATPGAVPAVVAATVIRSTALATPVVATRSAGDGVHVSWSWPSTWSAPSVFEIWSSPHGADTWTLIGHRTATYFADTSMAPGETRDYRVDGHTTATITGSVSAVVPGTRAPTVVTADDASNKVVFSTPSMTWSNSADSLTNAFVDVPDGPGTYDLQSEVHLRSAYYGALTHGCGFPSGTVVVRELARAASGAIIRLDATISGTCHGGAAFAAEARIGVAGPAYQSVVTGVGTEAPDPSWVGRPFTVQKSFINSGTTPVTLGTATYSLDGISGSVGVGGTCATTLAPGTSCTVDLAVTATTEGTGTITLTLPGAGLLGSTSVPHRIHVVLDAVPPVVSPRATPAFVDLTDNWIHGASYADALSGPTTEDIRYRYARATSGAFTPVLTLASWQGIRFDAAKASLTAWARMTPGIEYCVSYRAHDNAGNTSAWTPEQCSSLMWDDWVLTPGAGSFVRGVSGSYSGSTWTRSTLKGSTLTGPQVVARRVAVEATTCAACGTVDVYVGSTRLGSLNLHTNRTHVRQVLVLPLRTKAVSGRLRLVVTSANKPVIVDGLGARLT